MKTAIYIRVSTEEQAKEGYPLELQREYLGSSAKRETLKSLESTKMVVLVGTFSIILA